MEDKKYYTPDISELFVGYECEIEDDFDINEDKTIKIIYTSWKMEASHGWMEIPDDICNRLRTKYLDKEDIEACGWERSSLPVEDDDEKDVFIDGYELYISEQLWYCLYQEGGSWIISKRWYRNSVGQSWKTIYDGEIKSINELRKLMKWLNIKE